MICTRRLECALLDRRGAGTEKRVREVLVMVKRIIPWNPQEKVGEAVRGRDWELACIRVLDSAFGAIGERKKKSGGQVSGEDVREVARKASAAMGEILMAAYESGDAGSGHREWSAFCNKVKANVLDAFRDTIFFSEQERLELSTITTGERGFISFVWMFAESGASQRVKAAEAARQAEKAPAA